MEANKLKNKNKVTEHKASQGSRYREVLELLIKCPPKNISIGDWDYVGDLVFSINMNDIGLDYKDYVEYEEEFFSYFIVDILGELIIRENLNLFVDKLKKYDINDYMTTLKEHGAHKRFGVMTYKGKLIFQFHASLLKDILTEGLREKLGDFHEK